MEQPEQKKTRGQRRSAIGVVTRDKMNKTRRVEIARLVKHPRYGKFIRRRTVCYVHDEANDSRNGDTVEIMETRPLSKMKHWRLVKVLKRAPVLPQPGKQAQAAAEGAGETAAESGEKAEG